MSSTHLFDSGPLTPPGAFDWAPTAAGGYTVSDSASGHSTTIQVPTQNPTTASVGVPFTVVWSTAPLPAGYSETVQVLLPGTTAWTDLEGEADRVVGQRRLYRRSNRQVQVPRQADRPVRINRLQHRPHHHRVLTRIRQPDVTGRDGR